MESRNVIFLENIFPSKITQEPSSSKRVRIENDEIISESTEEEPRRGKGTRTGNSYGDNFLVYLLETKEPNTYNEVMSTPEAPF